MDIHQTLNKQNKCKPYEWRPVHSIAVIEQCMISEIEAQFK